MYWIFSYFIPSIGLDHLGWNRVQMITLDPTVIMSGMSLKGAQMQEKILQLLKRGAIDSITSITLSVLLYWYSLIAY